MSQITRPDYISMSSMPDELYNMLSAAAELICYNKDNLSGHLYPESLFTMCTYGLKNIKFRICKINNNNCVIVDFHSDALKKDNIEKFIRIIFKLLEGGYLDDSWVIGDGGWNVIDPSILTVIRIRMIIK